MDVEQQAADAARRRHQAGQAGPPQQEEAQEVAQQEVVVVVILVIGQIAVGVQDRAAAGEGVLEHGGVVVAVAAAGEGQGQGDDLAQGQASGGELGVAVDLNGIAGIEEAGVEGRPQG